MFAEGRRCSGPGGEEERVLTRSRLIVVALAVLVAGNGVAAAAVKPDAGARLAATTAFDASASSRMAVRLDKPAQFRLPDRTKPGSLRLSGGGRMLGFVLRSKSVAGGPILILGGRIVREGRQYHSAITMTPQTLDPLAEVWTLPAGVYDLYVVTDGTPARLDLALGGLTGRGAYTMRDRAASKVADPEKEILPQGQQRASAHGRLGGQGVLLSIASLHHSLSVSEVFSQCVHAGEPQATDFLPGCPGADTSSNSVVSSLAAGKGETGHIMATVYSGDDPLSLSQGYYLTNVGINEYVDYGSMWLTY